MRGEAEQRFVAFVTAESANLLRLGLYLTADGHAAEDLVQTALTKTYLAWRRVEAAGNPVAYVRRVMVNAATDAHRARTRRAPEHLTDHQRDTASDEDVAAAVAAQDGLRRLLARLPAKQRAVLALRYGADLSEQETADALGIGVGTVKSHTSRALAKLREAAAAEEAHRV